MRPRSIVREQDARDELERFKRGVNLTEVAASKGYRIDRRESSQGSVVMRDQATDDKIVIARRAQDDHWTYFSVRDPRDKGTVVDFIQRRSRATLGEVRKELRGWIGGVLARPPVEDFAPTLASPERDRSAVARAYDAARPAPNSEYLNRRGIRPETLSADRFANTFRVDSRGNVLFPHHDTEGLCGFESKNHRWTSFATGGRRALWTSRHDPRDRMLVLVESAVDALSHYQLRPDPLIRYASTAGALGQEQFALVRHARETLAPGSLVALAFDADAAGDRLAAAITAAVGPSCVERYRPPIGKDWNDMLKVKERDYIRAIERTASRGRGLL